MVRKEHVQSCGAHLMGSKRRHGDELGVTSGYRPRRGTRMSIYLQERSHFQSSLGLYLNVVERVFACENPG